MIWISKVDQIKIATSRGKMTSKKYQIEIKNIAVQLKDMNPEKLIRWAMEDIFAVSSDDVIVKEE